MIGESTLLKTMRNILWLVATCLGGMGIAAVWGSFHNPDCGSDALLMLSTATFITLGMPPEPTPARRQAFASPSARNSRFAAKLRQFVEACGFGSRPR